MYLILNTCVHSSDVNPGQYIYHQYVYTVRIQTCVYLYASIFIIHIYMRPFMWCQPRSVCIS